MALKELEYDGKSKKELELISILQGNRRGYIDAVHDEHAHIGPVKLEEGS